MCSRKEGECTHQDKTCFRLVREVVRFVNYIQRELRSFLLFVNSGAGTQPENIVLSVITTDAT